MLLLYSLKYNQHVPKQNKIISMYKTCRLYYLILSLYIFNIYQIIVYLYTSLLLYLVFSLDTFCSVQFYTHYSNYKNISQFQIAIYDSSMSKGHKKPFIQSKRSSARLLHERCAVIIICFQTLQIVIKTCYKYL